MKQGYQKLCSATLNSSSRTETGEKLKNTAVCSPHMPRVRKLKVHLARKDHYVRRFALTKKQKRLFCSLGCFVEELHNRKKCLCH